MKLKRVKELPYHYDIVTPYIRYKYMTDVLYNRMIEIGFWWWRWEFHFKGKQTFTSGRILKTIDILVKIAYYTVVDTITRVFKRKKT